MDLRKNPNNIVLISLLNGMLIMARITGYDYGELTVKDPRLLVEVEKMPNGLTKFSLMELKLCGNEPVRFGSYNYWQYLDTAKFKEIEDMYCQATGSIITVKQPFNMN